MDAEGGEWVHLILDGEEFGRICPLRNTLYHKMLPKVKWFLLGEPMKLQFICGGFWASNIRWRARVTVPAKGMALRCYGGVGAGCYDCYEWGKMEGVWKPA